MRAQYAERAFVGGTNAEMVGFAGGLNDISAPVTHENDHNLPETYLSRIDRVWRVAAKKRLAQAAAFFVLSAGASACVGGEQHTPSTLTPGIENSNTPGSTTSEKAPSQEHAECYTGFTGLSAARQEECRHTMANLSLSEVAQLAPIDQTRWSHYYRYVVAGESTPLSSELIPAAALEPNDVGGTVENVAGSLLLDYQESIYKTAWLVQNNPSVCADSRTLQAMLGSNDTTNPDFLLAQSIARSFPAGSKNLQDYAASLHTEVPLFRSLSALNPKASKKGDAYQLQFGAESSTGTIHFTFELFPYVNQVTKENGVFKESMITYDSPEAQKIFEKLHKRLIVSTPQITR